MSASPLPVAPVELAVGDELPAEAVGPITRTDIVRYAGAAGDFNPMHHDEPFAQAAGVPSVLAMGMLHAGILGNRLARWVGPEQVRSFGIRLTGQVFPGDVLALSGRVEAVDRDGDRPLASIVLGVERQTGEEVVRATATAVVR